MEGRRRFEKWVLQSLRIANLKSAIAVQGFLLVAGTLVITSRKSGDELFLAFILIAYQSACAVIFESRLRRASYFIGIPNLLLFALVAVFGSLQNPLGVLWVFCTGMMALVCLFVSRMPLEWDTKGHGY